MISAEAFVKEQDWSKNVKPHNNGNVVIRGIPEVNQKGGYCVPGSVAMIIGYFDGKLSQDRLAKLFDSDISEGTSLSDMVHGFSAKKLFKDYRIKTLYDCWDIPGEIDGLVMAYLAEEARGREVKEGDIQKMRTERTPFALMDPTIAKRAFVKHRKKLADFFRTTVRANIDAGIPLLWSVYLKFDPRDMRASGHCRVITGYVVAKDGAMTGILYSDSWGKLSRDRSVSFDDAITMTEALFLILPRTRAEFSELAKEATVAVLPHDVAMEFVNVPASKVFPEFQIGKYEVTQQQYTTLIGKNLSRNKGENFPVEKVSFDDAIKFCKRLTEYERKAGRIGEDVFYTLPTREQWLYAFFAGTSPDDSPMSVAQMCEFLREHGYIAENSGRKTHPVGEKEPNEWGIYDMIGNVSEWCREGDVIGFDCNFPSPSYGNCSLSLLKDVCVRQGWRAKEIGFRVVRITIPKDN